MEGFPGGSDGKGSACNAGDQVRSLGQEDPLEKGIATHSSNFAWRIPWTEVPFHGVAKSRTLKIVYSKIKSKSLLHIIT